MGMNTYHFPSEVAVSVSFSDIVVRPIQRGERDDWDRLMSAHHYLGLRSLVGESLRYVAEVPERWLALLGWSTAAFKCRPRDAWIGWLPEVQWQRLSLIANNARFLMLPGIRIPNLASKVLSLNVRRLAYDWDRVHGHPVLLAETFVDTARFTGACYKAANWQYLGHTRGYSKNARVYTHHGQAKAIFVLPLCKDARVQLSDPSVRPLASAKVTPQVGVAQADGLMDVLKRLPDPRQKRGVRHRNISLIALSACAVVCGCRSYAAIAQWAAQCSQKVLERLWCRKQGNRYIAPSEPTFRRHLQRIDAEAVDAAISSWVCGQSLGQTIGIDGKTVRGARRSDGSQVHLLSAFLHQEGLTIAQREVSSKTNEIPEAKPLLAPLDLQGKIVTADALHTQKGLARFLVEDKQADYCFTVKDNQPNLKEDIAYLGLNEDFPPSA
jgi:hypothetical protein